MWVARTVLDARKLRRDLAGRVAFVPTMGALHRGHVSLMESARRLADHVVVSIFVNPTQFAPHEDFAKYPRPIEADLAACETAGVSGVFHPDPLEMYPANQLTSEVNIPQLASILEGAVRPTHFAGVCRVVAKLFNIIQPDVACFGQKDYQQVRVIQAMVDDLNMPVTIAELATVRESDGLALSSRNVYLDPEQRRHAGALYKALQAARLLIESDGETEPANIESAMKQIIESHQVTPDYAVVRHPQTLAPLDSINPALTGGVVVLVAGRLGSVRLIDNMVVGRNAG
ncbi:MAG: pantoate--beta-alanine ligase [Phycisphaeraceae bacterium]|nr:pantoate--beta-alanine ligase [Phycisphaeraceae bacterium]